MSIFDFAIGPCGCCEPPAPGTPEHVTNRPSLDEVGYRVGRYPTFRQAMIQLIPDMGSRLAREAGLADVPLARWTTRESDDYGIALIEMWATIGHILTFYQERYANEAWLRTADGRDAIRRLAGLLGYRLSPGVAAETNLAYFLEEGVDLDLAIGLRSQSVPKEGETPQKYETATPLAASASLNRVPVFGPPSTTPPLTAGRTRATLDGGSHVPVVGNAVLLFTANGLHEQRTIATVTERDGRTVITWSRPLGSGHARAFVRGRTWRLFGSSAPPTYLTSTPVASPPAAPDSNFLTWKTETTDYTASGTRIDLEGSIDGIELDSKIVVDDNGVTRFRTVHDVSAANGSIGAPGAAAPAQSGPATRLLLSATVTVEVTEAVVYEMLDELEFQDWELPPGDIPSGTPTIYLPYPEVDAIEKGRILIVDDETNQPMLVTVAADAEPFAPGMEDEFLKVELASPTTRALDASSAFVFGNVVNATHGETVADEVLGDGDAAAVLQEFTVKKHPVTFTSDPTATGGTRNSLKIAVNRVRWAERSGLYGATPADRMFTTEVDNDQKMTVRFGDGRTGAALATGRSNVVATYRHGIGDGGNVASGQITTALDKPTGLKEVTNPLPATGGVDPETIDAARLNAPNTVRTFDRAISVSDFAHLSREFVGVAKAHADWAWDGEERVIYVTVGGEKGAALGSKLTDLRTYLDLRRDPNRSVRLGEYRPVPFLVTIDITAHQDYYNEDVAAGVRAEIESYFAYDQRRFGQAVHLSDIYAVAHAVDAVVSARITLLQYKRFLDRLTHGGGFAPVQVHAPIFGARHVAGTLRPAELATLVGPPDLIVNVTGGLTS